MPLSRVRCALPLALLLAAALPSTVLAQAQATTGVIRGVVSAEDGDPIVDASITVAEREHQLSSQPHHNSRGVFVATLLPLGSYEVRARALGFRAESSAGSG